MILGWYSWVGTFQKTKSSSPFWGEHFRKVPPKAEELFYFVRVSSPHILPLNCKLRSYALWKTTKKKSKEKFPKKLLQMEFIHHFFPYHGKLYMVLT